MLNVKHDTTYIVLPFHDGRGFQLRINNVWFSCLVLTNRLITVITDSCLIHCESLKQVTGLVGAQANSEKLVIFVHYYEYY